MSEEPVTTPEYSKIRNFWHSKSASPDINGGGTTPKNNNSTHRLNGTSSFRVPRANSTEFPSQSSSNPKFNLKSTNSFHSKEISSKVSSLESQSNGTMSDLAPSALEFDQEIVGVNLAEYLSAAQKLGGDVAEHATLVQKAFNAQRQFLAVATKYAKPGDAEFQRLLSDTANAITSIQQFREARRSSPFFNHLSGVSESIPALAWVTISPTPGPYIKEMNDAGQFYTNRVLKDFKEKPGHSEWVKAWIGTLVALQAYVKKNHTTGLVWGRQPYVGGAVSAPPSTGGPPPPPPPPTYEMDFENMKVSDERGALFAELNKGDDITKSLKKISADQMTHKNPALRAGGTVPSDVKGGGVTPGPKAAAPVQKPPKFSLEGKKWVIEYQIGKKDLKIEQVEMNQVVYMFGCKDSTIQIKGKLNSVVIDSCVKTAIVFDSVVASIEFVNCRDCQMQVLGKVPTITIDKVDGLQMFLSNESLQVEIVSAKSSALNVMVPQPSGEYTEWPIPEQFKTVIGPKGLITNATETVGV